MAGRGKLLGGMVGAALGVGVTISGVAVLAYQISRWVASGQWEPMPLLAAVKHPSVAEVLPDSVLRWLSNPRPTDEFQNFIISVLDAIPAGVFLVGLGLIVLWKASDPE